MLGVCLTSPALAQENSSATLPPVEPAAKEAPAPPARGAPRPPEPASSHSQGVSFVAAPGIAFYESAPAPNSPKRLCLAPCTLELQGDHTFALGLNGGDPVVAPETLDVEGRSIVEGEYQSNSGTRHTGWVVLGIGVPAGLAAVTTGLLITSNNSPDAPKVGFGTAAGGGIVAAVSLVVGLILALSSDEAHVHSRPASAAGM